MSIRLNTFTWDAHDSNAYLLCENRCGLLIDPVNNARLLAALADLDNVVVILTHGHFDHINGVNQVRQLGKAVCVVSTEACSRNIQKPQKNLSAIADALIAFNRRESVVSRVVEPFAVGPSDVCFDRRLVFSWEGHNVELVACFGHSNDSLLCVLDDRYLFSGDTILPIPTVTRLPGGSTERFWNEDMPKLVDMSRRIETVYPGHGMPGQLVDMIGINRGTRHGGDSRRDG